MTSPVPDEIRDVVHESSDLPVWLLDFDGVLNVPRPGWGEVPRSGRASAAGSDFLIRWAPPAVRKVRQLGSSGKVEIRWATTWVDWIGQIERMLGVPSWPLAFSRLGESPAVAAREAKVRAALHVVEVEARPLIWTDDAMPVGSPAMQRLTDGLEPVLLLQPDALIGLQPEDLAAIEAFIEDPWA